MCQACLPLPVPVYERPPYWASPTGLKFLHDHETTKAQARAALGSPDVRRADDRVWVYGGTQTRGAVLPGGNIVARHLLVIMFDEGGLLTTRGIFDDAYGCLRTGVCFSSHWYEGGEPVVQAVDFFQVAVGGRAARALSYEPPVGSCRFYVYSKADAGRAVMRLWPAGGDEMIRWWMISGPYFVAEDFAPGAYQLTVNVSGNSFSSPWETPPSAEHAIQVACEEGDLVFVRRKQGFWSPARLELRGKDQALKDLADYWQVEQPQDPGWVSKAGIDDNPS